MGGLLLRRTSPSPKSNGRLRFEDEHDIDRDAFRRTRQVNQQNGMEIAEQEQGGRRREERREVVESGK